jgi:hypothetical protein
MRAAPERNANGMGVARLTDLPVEWSCQYQMLGLPACCRSAQCTELAQIMVWLEVRVLRGPPRSLTQTEISQFSANSPEQGAFVHRFVSAICRLDFQAISGLLSLPRKIAFPDGGDWCWWRLGSNAWVSGVKSRALWEPTVDSGFDELPW